MAPHGNYQARRVLLAVVCIGVLSAGRALATDPRQGIARQGVKIESFQRTVGETIAWMKITVMSDTPVDATWAVLSNVAEWDEFVTLFQKVERLEKTAEDEALFFLVSPPWPIRDFTATVRTRQSPQDRVINWTIGQGELTSTLGRLSVERIDTMSKVIYESTGPAKNTFPNWAVKIGVYIVLPGIIEEFHQRIQEEMAKDK